MKDINPGPAGSHTDERDERPAEGPAVFAGALFFDANDGASGVELWKSDGTPDGTVIVEDIRPGAGHSSPSHLTVFKNRLFFSAGDGIHGTELWSLAGDIDLAITKVDLSEITEAGQKIDYGLVVTNQGPVDATGVVVTDTTPAGVAFVSASWPSGTCSESGGAVVCNIGSLVAGDSVFVAVIVRVDADAAGTTVVNKASVSATQVEFNVADNTAIVATDILPVVPDTPRAGDPAIRRLASLALIVGLVLLASGSVLLVRTRRSRTRG